MRLEASGATGIDIRRPGANRENHVLHAISLLNQTTLLTCSDSQAVPGVPDKPVRSRGSWVGFDGQRMGKATSLSTFVNRENFLVHRNYFHGSDITDAVAVAVRQAPHIL